MLPAVRSHALIVSTFPIFQPPSSALPPPRWAASSGGRNGSKARCLLQAPITATQRQFQLMSIKLMGWGGLVTPHPWSPRVLLGTWVSAVALVILGYQEGPNKSQKKPSVSSRSTGASMGALCRGCSCSTRGVPWVCGAASGGAGLGAELLPGSSRDFTACGARNRAGCWWGWRGATPMGLNEIHR